MTTEEHHGADFASVAHARLDALEARQDLADIIDQLAAKADVKARLGRQLQAHKREVAVMAAGLIAAAVGLVLWRRR